jgi:glycosyltransferase involved in cell wall biosynthesis
MKINILLPYKEKFDVNKASSVSITVKNNLLHTEFLNHIKIYGQNVENPLFKNNFEGIKYSIFSLKSRNVFLTHKMLKIISKESSIKQLIEIHNRPYLIEKIAENSNFPITLFLHNDPQTMKGSKSVKDRQNILEKCEAVFCVSEFIKNKFLEGISIKTEKIYVLYNGVDRKIKKFPKKKKEILFVGRLVSEKGADLYVQAVRSIASTFPDWNFGLIGSFRLGEHNNTNFYAHRVIKSFQEIGSQAIFYGFKNHQFVEEKMKTASIIVIPSIWEEPFGLVAAEAMSNGISIIASKVGGMPEIIRDNGVLIDNINYKKLRKHLIELLKNKSLRENYQQRAWENFKLSSLLSSKKLDDYRRIIFQNYY